MQGEYSGLEHWVKWDGVSTLQARNLSTSHGSGATLYLGWIHRDHQPTLLNIKSKVRMSISLSCTSYFSSICIIHELLTPTHTHAHVKWILKIYSTFIVKDCTFIFLNYTKKAHDRACYMHATSSTTLWSTDYTQSVLNTMTVAIRLHLNPLQPLVAQQVRIPRVHWRYTEVFINDIRCMVDLPVTIIVQIPYLCTDRLFAQVRVLYMSRTEPWHVWMMSA